MTQWNNFQQLTRLDVVCHDVANGINPIIYGNSRNQAKITIIVGVEDNSGNPLQLSQNDVKHLLYICDSETGEKISSPWQLSDDANEYNICSNQNFFRCGKTAGSLYIDKYVSCSEGDITKYISVGIDIPGIGAFNTSLTGSATKNGPSGKSDSIFLSPKSFTISTLRPIDYSISENIIIDMSDAETVASNLKWESVWAGIYTSHDDGKCKRYIAHIKPNKSTTNQERFKKHEIQYKCLQNSDVNNGTIYWGSVFDCFSAIQPPSYPCAVTGKCEDNFHLNLWYPVQKDSDHIAIAGHFFVQDSATIHYSYKFDCGPIRKDDLKYEDGIVRLQLFKFILENNTKPIKWVNRINVVTVKVIDLYGNEGEFQLAFDDGEYFNEPLFKY